MIRRFHWRAALWQLSTVNCHKYADMCFAKCPLCKGQYKCTVRVVQWSVCYVESVKFPAGSCAKITDRDCCIRLCFAICKCSKQFKSEMQRGTDKETTEIMFK